MVDAWQVQEKDETRLSKTTVQSEEQRRNDILRHEKAVWRVPDISSGQDAEQGAGIPLHRLQYAQGDKSPVISDGFYVANSTSFIKNCGRRPPDKSGGPT